MKLRLEFDNDYVTHWDGITSVVTVKYIGTPEILFICNMLLRTEDNDCSDTFRPYRKKVS